MLPRILEPEVMNTPQEAVDYDTMDHGEVNRAFADDLLATGRIAAEVIDLGTGTAQIPIELCRRGPELRVTGVDLSIEMLRVGRDNVEAAGMSKQISLSLVDAKRMPWADGVFAVVMSNSSVHHIPHPTDVVREAVRVTAGSGQIFFRDLMRPPDRETLLRLVQTYAGGCNQHQQQMFEDSLRAALELEEMRELVTSLGFPQETVQATSDRHWTWSAVKQGS